MLLGDRPSALTLGGVVLVAPATWLTSSGDGARCGGLVEGAVDGILAGAGRFGVLFLALAQTGERAGPGLVVAAVAVVAITVG